MGEKETAFRVTGRLTVDYQIIVQAKDAEEAAYFATDIDLDMKSISLFTVRGYE